MSISLMSKVWSLDLSASTKLVALKLADYGDDDGGSIFPTQSRIAEDLCMKPSTVKAAFRILRDQGILVTTRYGRGKGNANEYQMVLPSDKRVKILTQKGQNTDAKGLNSKTYTSIKEELLTIKNTEALFADAKFSSIWDRWETFRKEIKHSLTPSTAKAQILMLSQLGPEKAGEVIEISIRNGWRGLFPDKVQDSPKPKSQTMPEATE